MASVEKLISIAGGPDSVRTVFDVGANDGADSLPLARRFPHIRFFAIEPTPELAVRLGKESCELENYTVLPCAIGRSDGQAVLKIRKLSLHNSLEPIIESNVAAVGIPVETYDVLEEVKVDTRTLKSLCDELKVPSIDVLHVDAQGSDLDVLVSAGPLLRTVRAGVVEAGDRLNLYTNTAGRQEIVTFLAKNNLRVVAMDAADPFNYEDNIFFTASTRSRYLDELHGLLKIASVELRYRTAHRIRARLRLRSRLRMRRSISGR